MQSYDDLRALPLEQLQEKCRMLNVPFHHKHKAETLVEALQNHEHQRQELIKNQADLRAPAEMPGEPAVMNTQAEILAVLKPLMDRGLQVIFNGDDTFTLKRGIKEDSVHMSAKLRWVQELARGVMRPAMQFKTARSEVDDKLVMMVNG